MLLFIKVSSDSLNLSFVDFKTSHVIVYPPDLLFCASCQLFQNISCYCLSSHAGTILVQIQLFQNISCYCLSILRVGSLTAAP